MAAIDLRATVDDFVATLRAAAQVTVDTNPGTLRTPGVLVQIAALTPDTLAGDHLLRLRVMCVADDAAPDRALDQLTDLYNAVEPHIPIEGDITAQTIALAGQAYPLPALAIPTAIPTTMKEID